MNKVIRDNSMLVFAVKRCRMLQALSLASLFGHMHIRVHVCVHTLLPVILAYLTEL